MPTPALFAAAWMVIVVGTQCTIPTTASLLTVMCPRGIYGKALGMQQAWQALARVLGPMIFGTVYDRVDHRFSFYVIGASTVLAGILIIMVPTPSTDGATSASQPTEDEIHA